MKFVILAARILLGLLFIIIGLNGFLPFLHMAMPTGIAGQYFGLIYQTHYIHFVWFLQIVAGVLLLAGYYVPLALTILGPILVNIFLFHLLIAHAGLVPFPVLALVLWLIVFWSVRTAFAGIFASKVGV